MLALLTVPLAGCGSSDLLSRDSEWFARPARIFQRTDLTISSTPLSQKPPVAPDELVGADGACAATATTASTGSTDGVPQEAAAPSGAGIALDQTECAVVRAAGHPDNIDISANERGERMVVLTYARGPRPGIYQFTAGRLSAMERGAEPAPAKKPATKKKKKSA